MESERQAAMSQEFLEKLALEFTNNLKALKGVKSTRERNNLVSGYRSAILTILVELKIIDAMTHAKFYDLLVKSGYYS